MLSHILFSDRQAGKTANSITDLDMKSLKYCYILDEITKYNTSQHPTRS